MRVLTDRLFTIAGLKTALDAAAAPIFTTVRENRTSAAAGCDFRLHHQANMGKSAPDLA
jgi:hypothetical protein